MRQCMIIGLVALGIALPARAERLKDIVEIEGIRDNPILGIGLVVGLNGTGDGSNISKRELANMLRKKGLSMEPDELSADNIAAVTVTTRLRPFARRGFKLDVKVSAMGSATSLQGGTLLPTELKGLDDQVYAIAEGSIAVGGFAATGSSSTVTKNHTTVGWISNGATVEREELADYFQDGKIILQLRNPDFTTANNVAMAVNELYPQSVTYFEAGSVHVRVPADVARPEIARFIQSLSELQVKVDQQAVVVINARTGTIIVGENVGISTVAISHGNLYIITEEKDFVSQPAPFAEKGQTEKIHRTRISTTEEKKP
ncbi:MAG: flagellar basal body P-ring protein FlgI, partial [Planctomycetota bacterium]